MAQQTFVERLHGAAQRGDRGELLAALRTAGADVNAAAADGTTALHLAALHAHPGVATLLLSRGANIAATIVQGERAGWQPLHCAAALRQNTPVCYTLLDAGADVNAADAEGMTPVHLAARECRWLLEQLLDRGADDGVANARGERPLHFAARGGVPNTVETLLKRGADPRAADAAGMTPLHHACRGAFERQFDVATGYFWETDLFAVLVDAGANINAVDNAGRRPLHCVQGCETWDDPTGEHDCTRWATGNVVELLKGLGADLDAVTDAGDTALSLALKRRDKYMAIALLEHGATLAGVVCRGRAGDAAQISGLQSLLVGVAAEAGRLQRKREALEQEREAWAEERAALARERAERERAERKGVAFEVAARKAAAQKAAALAAAMLAAAALAAAATREAEALEATGSCRAAVWRWLFGKA